MSLLAREAISDLINVTAQGILLKITFVRIKQISQTSQTCKNLKSLWLSKKLHIRGAHNLYYFGVLEYVVMI